MKRLTVLGLILSFGSSAGCIFGGTSTSPTNYTVVSPVTEVFQGTLDASGSVTYNFVIGNPDPLRITLASLTNPTTGASVATSVTLQLGTVAVTTDTSGNVVTNCTPTFTTTATAALVAQYFQVASPGNYCVVVADTGTLSSSVRFAVRIIHS